LIDLFFIVFNATFGNQF